MRHNTKSITSTPKLPVMFRFLLWSYTFEKVDPDTHRIPIIINTINYGDLKHWRWITRYYGKKNVQEVLKTVPITSFRPQVRPLAAILFDLQEESFLTTITLNFSLKTISPALPPGIEAA